MRGVENIDPPSVRNSVKTSAVFHVKTVHLYSTYPQPIMTFHKESFVRFLTLAFYPPWDGKMSTRRRAVMLCGWGVKAGMVHAICR